MTPEIILVLAILIIAVILLITEWIPMEVTALLSLGAVTLTGLVTPAEALSGFSNPAVVTGGDSGKPVVIERPDSPAARAFTSMGVPWVSLAHT